MPEFDKLNLTLGNHYLDSVATSTRHLC